MPLYEYVCDACGERFELIQKFSDGPPDACAKCGKGPVHRQISSPAFQFKGSGWYITDYARKGSAGEGESAKGEGVKGESAKGDNAKKTESTPASSSAGDAGDSKKSDAPSTTTAAKATPS